MVHGDSVAGAGQRVAQRRLHGGAVEQGVAQRIEQTGHQRFQLRQLGLGEAPGAAEADLAQVFAAMGQAVVGTVPRRIAELQAQVGAGMGIGQVLHGQQLLDLAEEHRQDALRLQAHLQLQVQLLAQLQQFQRTPRGFAEVLAGGALELGGIEIDGVGLLGRNHGGDHFYGVCEGQSDFRARAGKGLKRRRIDRPVAVGVPQ